MHDYLPLEGENWVFYQRNSITFMQNNHGKFHKQKSTYILVKPIWRPFIRYYFDIILYYVFCITKIKSLYKIKINECKKYTLLD